MKTKSTLRKELKLKEGRIQISNHGAGKHSIQVFSNGALVQDINVTAGQLGSDMEHVKQSLYWSPSANCHYLKTATGKFESVELTA